MIKTSQIEKISLGEGRWEYRISGCFNKMVQGQFLLWISLVLGVGILNILNPFDSIKIEDPNAYYLLYSIFLLSWLISAALSVMVFHLIWGKTLLHLTPQWIRIRYELWGIGISRKIRTSAFTNVDIVDRYLSPHNQAPVKGIDIQFGRQRLLLGSHLSSDEKQWLVREIKQYLADIPTPNELLTQNSSIHLSSDSIEIHLPGGSKSSFPTIVLFAILTGGGLFLLLKVGLLLQSNSKPFPFPPFLLSILPILWLAAEIAILITITDSLWSKEIIRVESNLLVLKNAYWSGGYEKKFFLEELGNLRTASYQVGSGKIAFDYQYNNAPITFARHLSDAEATTLCKQLNDILTFRCQAVEQIVFGEMPPTFIGTPETLLMNPDVSELSFPFIRLRRLILDVATHDPRRVERFLTYAVNAIGQRKLKESVDVHIYGDPALLQANLRNNLDNLFRRVEQRDILSNF